MRSFTLIKAANGLIGEYNIKVAELQTLRRELQAEEDILNELVPLGELYEEARVFLQELAEVARTEMMEGLQTAGTLGLQFVFGPELTFEIEVDTKRNNTAIEFWINDTSGPELVRVKPEENVGGGVLDSLSIGMRYGLLKVRKPAPIGPMFLDEPAKMVSLDLVPSIGQLMKTLARIFKKQTNIITHHRNLLEEEHTIYFKKVKGITQYETSRESFDDEDSLHATITKLKQEAAVAKGEDDNDTA